MLRKSASPFFPLPGLTGSAGYPPIRQKCLAVVTGDNVPIYQLVNWFVLITAAKTSPRAAGGNGYPWCVGEMKRTLGIFVVFALFAAVAAPFSHGEEQTREGYKAQVEPLCKANRATNERIMSGVRQRLSRNRLRPAGKQFIRVSASFGSLIGKLAKVPPPITDVHRIKRWLEIMKLLKTRLRLVGKYYIEGLKIKGNHEGILAERAGISANNTTIVLHFHDCRFGRFDRSG